MPSIDWNRRVWDSPESWVASGDEWTFHARACGRPYTEWKESVVVTFIDPYVGPEVDLLELGPGHGRWTEFMADRVRSLTLVDLNPSCIDACREKFQQRDFARSPILSFIANDGRSLPVPDESIDMIWSFGSLVHIDKREIDSYLAEFQRVLRPGGQFFAHHAGWSSGTPVLAPLTNRMGKVGRVARNRLAQGQWRNTLDRSAMSAGRFRKLASHHGLSVNRQLRRWGDHDQYGLAVRDVVSIGSRSQ